MRPHLWLAVILAACNATEAPPPEAPPVPVGLVTAATESIAVQVEAVGTLEAEQMVEVRAKRAGRIVALPATEGVAVAAGAVLAQFDDTELRARVDQARASLAEATAKVANTGRQFDRMRRLRGEGIIAQQEHDDLEAALRQAAAGVDVARANLAFAEAQLADTIMVAPFAGIVGRRLVDVGTFVREGEHLMTIVDADPIEIVFAVPERYAAELRTGLGVAVSVASHGASGFPGQVTFVDPQVDRVNRTVTVKAVLANPDLALRPGQFGNVRLTLAEHAAAVVVPEEALVPLGNDLIVYVVDDGHAVARRVEIGERLPGRAEILTGLATGEVVVRAGQEKLRPDTRLRVVDVAGRSEG